MRFARVDLSEIRPDMEVNVSAISFVKRTAAPAAVSIVALASLVAIGGSQAATQPQVRLLETGSTLVYPLFNLWVPGYAKSHPNVQITTQGTGSGTGISQAISGVAQIGASDAYMSNPLEKAHPDMLNIPMAISSQMINYNIPGLNNHQLKLSGPTLAGIYNGSVRYWTIRRSPRKIRT